MWFWQWHLKNWHLINFQEIHGESTCEFKIIQNYIVQLQSSQFRVCKMTAEISFKEVKKHKSKKSLWMVIHNDVYDVTKFLEEVIKIIYIIDIDLNIHTNYNLNVLSFLLKAGYFGYFDTFFLLKAFHHGSILCIIYWH